MQEIKVVKIEKEEETQVILGHATFIKTLEDLYEAMMNTVPGIKFGIAFSEASGPKLIRSEGNDEKLKRAAEENMKEIAAGHTFIILFNGAYPINVLENVKNTAEVVRLYCATGNPLEAIIMNTEQGNSVIGVVDGSGSSNVESEADIKARRELLRKFGYKK